MNIHTEQLLITGKAGQLECALNHPDSEMYPNPRGLALVAHPHPLFGGTMENKVAQTLARTFVSLGYVTARMNFRGVGKSEGVHDAGIGETDDMETLLLHLRQRYPDLPLVLSGFSFGTFVQSRLHQRLTAAAIPVQRLVLIGAAAGKWAMPDIPADTILIHGELDDTIPLQAVFDWLRPQDIPVVVIPGADHFFHRRLPHIKKIVSDLWS
ncbi:alpha/beta hydrolase [Undibacterium sp. Ji22W]|uniref:alpha/beta hydrolase n=1 Tax=Undibacterium sp. Ji22W TaxID=3413038 RepID=UPI003BF44F7C